VPVVANGEVWTGADWTRCREVSGVADVMLGRGAVADPFLARRIRAGHLAAPDAAERAAEWQTLLPLLGEFRDRVRLKVEARHAPGRIKQWLHLLARNYPGAQNLFAEIRGLRTLAEVDQVLARHGASAGAVAEPHTALASLAVAARPTVREAFGCAA
jgi:tRNA-dihydrouridine synthase C